MLRPYSRGLLRVRRISIFKFPFSNFFSAFRADVDIFAERNFQRFEDVLFVEAKALAIGNVAHVGAKFSIRPKEIANRSEQLLDVIVLFDELRNVARRTRRGNVFEGLRGLRVEPHAGHVLRKQRDERQAEALVEVRDELVARHLLELAVVAEALLERQMPVHVVGIPPGVLQALPEEPRLADAANFMTPRDDAFLAVLPNQFAQRMHQLGLRIFEPLVVRTDVGRRSCSAALQGGIFSRFAGRRAEARRYTRGEVAIGRRDRAGKKRRGFSCAIQVHSASQTFSRQNSRRCLGSLRFGAKLGAGATSVCAAGAKVAASALRETPREEIPPCPAANSSARGSLPGGASLHLPASRRNAPGPAFEENLSYAPIYDRVVDNHCEGSPSMKKKRKRKQPNKHPKKKAVRTNCLEEATAAYFASLSPEALEEENRLGAAMASAAGQVNFDADE